MDLDSLDMPVEPERFKEICWKVGIALLMTQQAHVALCLYDVSYRVHNGKLKKEQAGEKLYSKLNNKNLTMGVIKNNIKKDAPLSDELSERVDLLVDARNWLAHRFEQELSPLFHPPLEGKEFDVSTLICKLENIAQQASEVVSELYVLGNELVKD